uniref:PA14 domain-containing protein n=1 Tax=Prosthecobacter sp. TaxID=1965333 RepID=UPI003783C3DF
MSIHHFRIPTFLLMLLSLETLVSAASVTDQNKWPAGQVPVGQTNGPDELDDIWQEQFNAWAIDPAGDTDNDGFINSLEAVAGTNPFVATDSFKIGNMTIVGNAVVFTSKVEAGKKYRVLSSDAPNGPVWAAETLQTPVTGTEYIPSANQAAATISIQTPGNTKKFYKLETSDVSSSGDGVSDWVKRKLGLVPGQTDSNGDGVSDMAEINQTLQTQDVITVEAETAFASEDGGPAGLLRLRRNNSLMGARIYYTLGGNATAGTDFAALSGFVDFAPGAKTATIAISPTIDAALEGGEAVTVTLNGGMIGNSTPVVIDENKKQATVIISNTTAPSGTGLLARYYDHSNGTYEHAANFGDAANYQYTRAGTTPNFTGTAVITPTGVSPARLATLLAALTPNTTQVRFSFNGGNLSTAVYNNQNFLVTAKTAATFTIALPPGAGLPTTSTSTCNFSIQPIHPGLIERVEAVNNDWIYGTPNFTTISHLNSPDNYSETFETYLAPTTAGNYRFQLDADDKARVLIDLNLNGTFDLPGEQVVEHGWDTAATGSPEDGTADNEIVGTFKITPVGTPYALAIPGSPTQRYKMRVEHVDASGDARCRLQWNIDGGAFANIPQANQFTHTQAMTWSYTAGNLVVTPTGGHSRSVGQNVDLSFSSGPLFRPGATSTHNGTLPISAVNGTTTFTVAIPQTTVTLTGATTTAGSATVGVSSVAGLYVGMSITGTGLPANEFITAIGTNSITITTGTGVTAQLSTDLTCRLGGIPVSIAGASTTAGSQTVLVPSIDGLATGMSITGPGLPTNATISAIGPGMILLSTVTGVTTQASTTLTAFLHPTSNVTGNGFVLNNTASTTIGVYNLIYPNTTFSGSPGRVGTFNQVTEQNNGIWGTGTPDAALINPDTFSVRWSGQVQPQFTEEYTFIVQADDGCTLKLNGQVQALKTLPGTNNDGSNYHYDSTTGTLLVNYVNARIKPGSFVAGETIRIDPASGNLTQANGSTYTYDAATGVAIVNYSNLTTNTPGGFIAGQIVELDPTSGTANTLANLRYTILSNPTANTFTVDFGINAFASETAGTATINVTDNRDIVVASVFPAGNASYTYTSATGVTVVDYATAGLLANTLTTGMQVVLDPTGGNLTNEIYTYKTITAHTATTFTVSYATGLGNSTGSMLFMAPGLTSVPAAQTTAMALTHYAGRHAANSVGNINLEIVNKPLKDWSSMGNERYVRFPVVGGTRYDIQLDYYESTGNARAQLYWQSASQPKQIIPTERLYPENIPQAPPVHLADTTATALVGGPFSYAVLGSNAGAVTVSGLPAGLSYLNGFISGTATTAGDYQILISITNAAGTSTSVLNLHVEAAGGNVVREVWAGISGTSISSIPLSTAPSSTSNLSSLQAPVDAADDFGARMRGYITAPTTGNYYFWLNASDSAEFWLSNDDETINSFKRATV